MTQDHRQVSKQEKDTMLRAIRAFVKDTKTEKGTLAEYREWAAKQSSPQPTFGFYKLRAAFGTWGGALEAAGVKVRNHRRWSDDEIIASVKAYVHSLPKTEQATVRGYDAWAKSQKQSYPASMTVNGRLSMSWLELIAMLTNEDSDG